MFNLILQNFNTAFNSLLVVRHLIKIKSFKIIIFTEYLYLQDILEGYYTTLWLKSVLITEKLIQRSITFLIVV